MKIVEGEMIRLDHGAQTGKESTMTTQDKFQRLAEARLQELVARIEQLKAQAKQADAEARIEIDRHVKSLSDQKDAIQSKLTQIKNAGESAFAELKAGLEMALNDMKTALEEAKAKFGD